MPAGLAKAVELDTVGNATSLTYTRVTDCSNNCTWLSNTAEHNIHGQMVAQGGLPTKTGGSTTQKFDYDAVGRLAEVEDDSAGQCTIRRYEFDVDSNRTAKKTYALDGNGDCDPTSTPATKANTFDDADRITNTGYEYDAFGRTIKTPEADAGGTGDMTATYYANDLARSITQDGKTQTLTLDPLQRMSGKVKSGGWSGSETYAYSDDSDSPAWIEEGSTWTRWVAGIGGDVAATQKSDGYLGWTISNIRGDMIAEAGGGGIFNAREVDEFGVVKDGLPASRPYGFHGSKTRQTLTEGGVIAMGVRLYSPNTGRFLQTDPVLGGTGNPYEYPSDPANNSDLSGESYDIPYTGVSIPSWNEMKHGALCLKRTRNVSACRRVNKWRGQAERYAAKFFPTSDWGSGSMDGGAGDAFRHCYWVGLMTLDAGGKFGLAVGRIHEELGSQDQAGHEMDYFNNAKGFRYAQKARKSRSSAAARRGKLRSLCRNAAGAGGNLIRVR